MLTRTTPRFLCGAAAAIGLAWCVGCTRPAETPAPAKGASASAPDQAKDNDDAAKSSPSKEGGPRFRIVGEGADARIVVDRLPRELLQACRNLTAESREWSGLVSIRTGGDGDARDIAGAPPMAGNYAFANEAVEFRPRFSLAPGVKYAVRLHSPSTGTMIAETQLSLPESDKTPVATVIAVFPSTDVVPENLLKFYLHFSHPMSRGEAYKRIRLVRVDGRPVEHGFYELDEELWDPAGGRFTLRFDPGRVKRGLKPREEEGPVLEEGGEYRLIVDSAWPDAEGRELKKGFEKTFRAGPPDDAQPRPLEWTLRAPAAETGDRFEVLFPEPLDRAMLERSLWVLDPGGERIAGAIAVSDNERRWHFQPKQPWRAGRYTLAVDANLEDLAGNSPARPFEVDIQETITETPPIETVYVPFEVQTEVEREEQ